MSKKPDAPASLTPRSSAGEEFTAPARQDRSDTKNDISWWRRVVKHERIRHASVEKILTLANDQLERHVDDLRQQIADLRSAAITATAANFKVGQR